MMVPPSSLRRDEVPAPTPRNPVLIALSIIAMLLLTIVAFVAAIVALQTLFPNGSGKESRLAVLLIFPSAWVWKRFIRWCGMNI